MANRKTPDGASTDRVKIWVWVGSMTPSKRISTTAMRVRSTPSADLRIMIWSWANRTGNSLDDRVERQKPS